MAIVVQILINALITFPALAATSLSFIYATTKIFHLAHGAVIISAGYAFWWFWISLSLHPALAVLLAVAVAAIIGVLMNELVYESLRRRGARGLGYLIATLALLMLSTGALLAFFGAAPKVFRFQTETLSLLGANITALQVWNLIVTAALLALFFWIVNYTKFGKAMRATADNETVAEVLGIDTKKIRRWAFALVSLLAGATGIISGLEFNLDPNMSVLLAVRGFAAAVIGGVGSFGGAIIGALIVGFGEQAAAWFLGSGWKDAVVFILLFLFLLFKPEGIFGSKRVL